MCFQLNEEHIVNRELELDLQKKQAEWQSLENQWQTEHDEEVQALEQQNQQLTHQLEQTNTYYQDYIEELDKQVRWHQSSLHVHNIPLSK